MSIVLGFDGRASSQRALPVAISLARELDVELLIVCGIRPAGTLGEEYAEMEAAILEEDAPAVKAGLQRALAAGVRASSHLIDGSPTDAILDAADRYHARMIVVGYGEAGRLRAALGGAVALKVLQRTEVPLLVVP